jgi:DNA-binding NarL/FixJ family response regulator
MSLPERANGHSSARSWSRARGSGTIRVAIFDPIAAYSQGLIEAMSSVPDFVCVATATTESAAGSAIARTRPDIVVLGALFRGADVAAFVRRATRIHPRVRFLILGEPRPQPFPARLFRTGVSGYLLKDCSTGELVRALRAVSEGKCYLTPPIATALVDHIRQADDPLPRLTRSPWLTEREAEVLEFLAAGSSSPSIAATLHVSVRTVENHVRSIYRKLGVHHRAQAVQFALRQGFLASPAGDGRLEVR